MRAGGNANFELPMGSVREARMDEMKHMADRLFEVVKSRGRSGWRRRRQSSRSGWAPASITAMVRLSSGIGGPPGT